MQGAVSDTVEAHGHVLKLVPKFQRDTYDVHLGAHRGCLSMPERIELPRPRSKRPFTHDATFQFV